MLVDSKQNIWVGTWSEGLFRYHPKNKKWIEYPQLNEYNSAHVIFEDSQNRIWIGSFGKGITLLQHPYDMKKLSWITFSAEDPTIIFTQLPKTKKQKHFGSVQEKESVSLLCLRSKVI